MVEAEEKIIMETEMANKTEMGGNDRLLATTAAGVAEIARDMLTYAAADAGRLANAAGELALYTLTGDDPIGRAYALSADAVKLEQKIRSMIADLDPLLAAVVASDGLRKNEHVH